MHEATHASAPRRPNIVFLTGAVDFLGPGNSGRRFFPILPAKAQPLRLFRITAPGHEPYEGLFASAAQAQDNAGQLYPDTHPASVVCVSRMRQEARPC